MSYPETTPDDLIRIKRDYDLYWKPLIEEHGEVDMERVYAELSDFREITTNYERFMDYATGSQLTNARYILEDVIAAHEQYFKERFEYRLEDELDLGVVRVDTNGEEFNESLIELLEKLVPSDEIDAAYDGIISILNQHATYKDIP